MAAFHPAGEVLALGGGDRLVSLWEVASGRRLATLAGHGDAIHDLAFSPDGKRLATASSDETVRIWDPAAGELLLTLPMGTTVWAVTWHPDGRRLAALTLDSTIRILDASPQVIPSEGEGSPPWDRPGTPRSCRAEASRGRRLAYPWLHG